MGFDFVDKQFRRTEIKLECQLCGGTYEVRPMLPLCGTDRQDLRVLVCGHCSMKMVDSYCNEF